MRGLRLACLLGLLVSLQPFMSATAQVTIVAGSENLGPAKVATETRATEKGHQWVTGSVRNLSGRFGPFDGKSLATVLEALGTEPPPPGTKVQLLAVPSRYRRLERLIGGASDPVGSTVDLKASGRFEVRAPVGRAWKIVVTAPGFVPMETFLPRFPIELELAPVWLIPATTDTVTPDAGPEGDAPRGAEASWVASMWSESPSLDAQQRLGPWRRSPVRLWARGAFRVQRGTDEVLGLLVTHGRSEGMTHGADREALFLVPKGHEGGEFEDLLLEQRGPLISSVVRVVRESAPEGDASLSGAPDSGGVLVAPVQGAILTVDGRPVGASDAQGLVHAEIREAAQLAAVAEDGSWARNVAVRSSAAKADEESTTRPISLVLVAGREARISVRDARSGSRVYGAVAGRQTPSGSGEGSGAEADGESGDELSGGTIAMTLDAESLVRDLGRRESEGESGRARMEEDRFFLGQAQGQTFTVDVAAVGYLGARVTLSGSSDPTTTAEAGVVLLRQAMAEGRVATRTGVSLADVDLVAVPVKGTVKPSWAHSNGDGLFRLRQLAPDTRYGLYAMHREYPVRAVAFTAPGPGHRRQDLLVSLYSPLRTTGWVLDDADGLPIAGATARMFWEGSLRNARGFTRDKDAPSVIEKLTNEEGQFVFEDVSPGTYGFEVIGPGWATILVPSREVSEAVAQVGNTGWTVEVGTFFMVAESTLSVQVVDADESPVIAATVWWSSVGKPRSSAGGFINRDPRLGSRRGPSWTNGAVGDGGLIHLTGVEAESSVSLLVEAPGFVGRRVDELVIDWPRTQEGLGETVVVPLVRAASVSGFVANFEGRRLPNVHVSILSPSQAGDFPTNLYQRTDSQGEFYFDGLPPGKVVISANPLEAASIDPLALELELGEAKTDVALVEPPSVTVEGIVSSSIGPVAEVSVVCDGQMGTTDSAGYFHVDHVRLGTRQIEARLPQRNKQTRSIVVSPGSNWVDFNVLGEAPLGAGGGDEFSVSGRILADEGAEPPVVQVNGVHGSRWIRVVEGTFTAEGLSPGTYGIVARGELKRFDSKVISLVDRDIAGLVLDVRTPPQGSVRVTVQGLEPRDEESFLRFSLPVRLVRPEGAEEGSGNRANRFGNDRRISIPWRDGAFVAEGLPVGRWTIEASVQDGLYRASQRLFVEEGLLTNVTLAFERTDLEKFLGQLTVDGRPSTGWIVGKPLRPSEALGGVEDLWRGSLNARANALGQFEINLPIGEVNLVVSVANTAMGSFRLPTQFGVPLNLNLRRVRIWGRVLQADRSPAVGFNVVAVRPSVEGGYAARSETQTDGGFVIETLTLGEVMTLQVTGQNGDTVLWAAPVQGTSGEGGITVILPPGE